MKVMLNDSEIKKALVNYVVSQGIDISGKEVVVDMTAGRGENGFSANIDIVDTDLPIVGTTDETTSDEAVETVADESNPLGDDESTEEPDDSTNLFPSPA